jgi:hydrogenase maturation protease
MADLREVLRASLTGRVCIVGVGNPDCGDDGLGMRLADSVRAAGHPDVILAERTPERWVGRLTRGGFQTILFLDAVEMGASPGAAVFLSRGEIAARCPQISTHKLSLSTLARLIEADGPARVFLLGVQPRSVGLGSGLSAPVQLTLDLLQNLLADVLAIAGDPLPACGERL